MIGSIIGAVGSIVGGALSASASRKAAKVREEELKKREERQAATYARRVNQDFTQRADAQRMLKMTRDALKQRAEAAAGRQAVMGTTDSAMGAEREAAGEIMSNTASQIAAQGEAYKDQAEQQYEQQQDANAQERANIAAGKAQATGQAVGQMVTGLGQAAGALTGLGDFKTTLKIPEGAGNIPKPTLSNPVPDLPKVGIQPIDIKIGENVPGYKKIRS